MRLHIGIDDTDSRNGGCTTYIAAVLVQNLVRLGCGFFDYPNIVRLNPNIPFKTRGNAAVALRLLTQDKDYEEIEGLVLGTVEKLSKIGEKGTDPAVVILRGDPKKRIRRLAVSALSEVVSPREALAAIQESGGVAALYGAKLGVVGATAAIGQTLLGDHTFELVAYRTSRHCGTQRRVDKESVRRMDRLTAPETFNNYDLENNRVLITPHGPDPVLLGVRGETAQAVLRAYRLLNIQEPVERWVIFRTNHGTDAHFGKEGQVRTYSSAVVRGIVRDQPTRTRGGHVFFSILGHGRKLNCAAFEPTGNFRNIIAELTSGDEITVFGGVHDKRSSGYTINLEKIFIHQLTRSSLKKNPVCPRCKRRLKSAGTGKGFKCVKCRLRSRIARKIVTRTERTFMPGWYLPGLTAHRHLTKPLVRIGREKTWDELSPAGVWHEP